MKQYIISLIFLLGAGSLTAQRIHLDFPYFGGKDYVYILVEADKNDTILIGSLDKKGQATLAVPKSYSGYVGISLFRLIEGGGLDIVLNGEKEFTIRCTEAQPNENNIFYIDSPENNYLHQSYQKQEVISEKYNIVRAALEVYSPQDSLYSAFEQERNRLEEAFSALQTEIRQSPLCAAHFRLIHNFLRGVGSRLEQTEDEKSQALLDFVSKTLDMESLYTSNLWNMTLEQWMDMQSSRKNDALLLSDTQEMLSRTHSKEIYRTLLNKIIALYSRFGKDELLSSLDVNLFEAGNLAPAIIAPNAKYTPINTLVVFHESGCNMCENELAQLIGNYPVLREKGYEIISIAADQDKETFEKTAAAFPWKEKLCDYKGFDGVNFKNFQIIGAPTMFVTDKEGKIVGRYSRLVDTKLLGGNN
jgi:peroxiredoxin